MALPIGANWYPAVERLRDFQRYSDVFMDLPITSEQLKAARESLPSDRAGDDEESEYSYNLRETCDTHVYDPVIFAIGRGGLFYKPITTRHLTDMYNAFFSAINFEQYARYVTKEIVVRYQERIDYDVDNELFEARIRYFTEAFKTDTPVLVNLIDINKDVLPHTFIMCCEFADITAEEATGAMAHIIYEDVEFVTRFLTQNLGWNEEIGYFMRSFLPENSDIDLEINRIFGPNYVNPDDVTEVKMYVALEAAVYYIVRLKLLACKRRGGSFVLQDNPMFDFEVDDTHWFGLSTKALTLFVESGMNTGIDFFYDTWAFAGYDLQNLQSMRNFDVPGGNAVYGFLEDRGPLDEAGINHYNEICGQINRYVTGDKPFGELVKYDSVKMQDFLSTRNPYILM